LIVVLDVSGTMTKYKLINSVFQTAKDAANIVWPPNGDKLYANVWIAAYSNDL